LFSVIFVYSLSQIISFYHSGGVAALPVEVRQALYSLLLQDEKSLNALMREIYLIFYGSIVLTSLLYQGGLFLFYRRHVSPTAKS